MSLEKKSVASTVTESASLFSTLKPHNTDRANESSTAWRSFGSSLSARKCVFDSMSSSFGPMRSKWTRCVSPISPRSSPIGFDPTPAGNETTYRKSSLSRLTCKSNLPPAASHSTGRKPRTAGAGGGVVDDVAHAARAKIKSGKNVFISHDPPIEIEPEDQAAEDRMR